nr:putative dioxygenase [uncultured bacterium]
MGDDAERLLVTRRLLLRLGLLLPVPLLSACPAAAGTTTGAAIDVTSGAPTADGTSGPVPPTPECHDGDKPTVARDAGPYFTPGSPERSDLRTAGVTGTPLTVAGLVVDTRCRPVGRALLDFWQADARGDYDNDGFRLRGHQYSGADGTFRLETIVPGAYGSRTRHLHVKVQAPGGPVLTTQLYFPGEARNAADDLFDDRLVMRVRDGGGQRQAGFLFVLTSR